MTDTDERYLYCADRIQMTTEGFRIPQLEVYLQYDTSTKPRPEPEHRVLDVKAYPAGWQITGTALVPTHLVATLLTILKDFAQKAPCAATPPAPATHPEVVKPRKKRPSRAKVIPGRGGHDPKPATVLPHPSHYPREVLDAPPPPEVPGGYPKDCGVWERLADSSHPQDEYGKKGGLIPVDDQKGGPG